jgi:hypothetical protein
MEQDQQGPEQDGVDTVVPAPSGDGRERYRRPELAALSVNATLTGAIVFTEELFNAEGEPRGGPDEPSGS